MTVFLLFGAGACLLLLVELQTPHWVSYAVVLLSLCSLVSVYDYPKIEIADFSVVATEIVLAVALLAAVVHLPTALSARWIERSPIARAMLVFMAACAVGLGVGMSSGVPLRTAAEAAREATFFVAFWLAILAWTTKRNRLFMLLVASALAVVSVALQIVQVALGSSVRVFVAGSLSTVVVRDPSGFLRVRPPGLTLVYVTASFAASYLLWGPRTRRLLVAGLLGLCLTGITLSFNRNMIIGIVLGIGAAGLLAPRKTRLTIALGLFATIVAVFLMLTLTSMRHTGGDLNPIISRVASIAGVDELRSGTLAVRTNENRHAREALRGHRLLGIGWGKWYGVTYYKIVNDQAVADRIQWIHNQYYHLWMRTGLLGLGALLVAAALAIRTGARRLWSAEQPDEAWLGGGIIAAVVSLLASSYIGLYLTESPSVVVFVGVLALAAVLEGEHAERGETPQRPAGSIP